MDDDKFHICHMTHQQYYNFKVLPIVRECSIVKKSQQHLEDNISEMGIAIELLAKNNLRKFRALSRKI